MLTICKSFIGHIDFRDIHYDQFFNNSFHNKLEIILHSTALAIGGVIRGTLPGIRSWNHFRYETLLYHRLKNFVVCLNYIEINPALPIQDITFYYDENKCKEFK